MSGIERITDELKALGYNPFYIDNSPAGRVVVIEYKVPTGKYIKETVLIGFSFQEEGYPEYPPHWIHTCADGTNPPYNDQLGGSTQPYWALDNKGVQREWLALSRPPGKLWDNLATKHIKHYLGFHITRFCKNLK